MAVKHSDGTITHVGLTLGYSHEHYNSSMDFSTFYALVWNPAENKTDSVYYGSNFSSQERGSYENDATPEVQADYDAYTTAQDLAQVKEQEKREYNRVEKGKVIDVIRGRKVPIGTRGLIFWIGNNGYGDSVGIITASGEKHFTAVTNVAVTGTVDVPFTDLTHFQAALDNSRKRAY